MIRADSTRVKVMANGVVAACHIRCYDRNQLIILPEHRLEALKLRSRVRAHDIEAAFDALGEDARTFHLELTTAQMNGTLELALKAYLKPSLLLLDELGYLPIDKRGADLLFQVVAARYESGSIVITTNRPFRDWGRIFDVDNTLATAMIDRLMHHGEAMVIQGSSFRTKGETPDE
ncbi:MAG: ATP-binding protein [Planctomyces sp.]